MIKNFPGIPEKQQNVLTIITFKFNFHFQRIEPNLSKQIWRYRYGGYV